MRSDQFSWDTLRRSYLFASKMIAYIAAVGPDQKDSAYRHEKMSGEKYEMFENGQTLTSRNGSGSSGIYMHLFPEIDF